jgi:hypothetical protein
MSKLTSQDKGKIVAGLIEVFKPYEAENSALFYYDHKRARVDRQTGKLVVEEGFNPRDYFEYCNENTISLFFDGSSLYIIVIKKFEQTFLDNFLIVASLQYDIFKRLRRLSSF